MFLRYKQIRWRKKERGNALCRDVPRRLCRSDRCAAIGREGRSRREQLRLKYVHIQQNKKAAAPIGIQSKQVAATSPQALPDSAGSILLDHHRSHRLHAGGQQGVPTVRCALVFRALHRIRELRRRGAAGVIAVGKDRRVQDRLNERRRVKKQPLATRLSGSSANNRSAFHHPHVSRRPISVAKVQSDRHDRRIKVRCSAVCRRVPERIEKPRAVGRSARSESRSGIHATEVGNRIDARDARQRRLLCSVQPRSCAVDARELQVEVSRECSGDLIGSRGLLRLRSAGDSKAPAKAECFGVFTGPGTEAPLRTV